MGSRLELHDQLLLFAPNVYFQPPPSSQMFYPCITYNKNDKSSDRANDHLYLSKQGYQLTVIDRDPDSTIADLVNEHFQYCAITQYYVVDNLYHVTLTLFY